MAPPVLAGTGAPAPTTPEIVAARSMWHYAQGVAWGAPLTLFWQVYSNEAGADPATGEQCDRGYWLVDRGGADAPVFTALQKFYAAARAFLDDHAARHAGDKKPRRGRGSRNAAAARPGLNAFRRWAVNELAALSGYGSGVPPPAFREIDEAAAAVGGGH